MGVKATNKVAVPGKADIVFVAVTSGLATFPTSGEASVFSILDGSDVNRKVEIANAQHRCYNWARDNGLLNSAGSAAFKTTLDTATVVTELIAASLVTGDVGIMISGTERAKGGILTTENAILQCIDHSRDHGRQAA